MIDVLVRAVILVNGKVLVCKKIGKKYYFLPGGHVEYNESAEKALKREIKEELGIKTKNHAFIGVSEHSFSEDGKKYHEINLVFRVEIDKVETKSKEKHLQFYLLNKNELTKVNVLPAALKKALLKWFKYKKTFWAEKRK